MSVTATSGIVGNRATEPRTLLACAAGFCGANIGWWIQPELISELVARGHLSEPQAGLVSSAELAALALSSVLLSRLVRGASLVSVAVAGAIVAILATLVSIEVTHYWQLLAARTLAGLGEGATFMAVNAAAAHLADPDRAYGKMNFANVVFGVGLLTLTPFFKDSFGKIEALTALLAALVILTPVLFCMPRSLRNRSNTSTGDVASSGVKDPPAGTLIVAVLATSLFLVAIMSAALWAFYALIGTQAGLTDSQVNHAITLSALGALVGSGLVALIGKSFGRLGPMTLGVVAATGASVVLCFSRNPYAYHIATCVDVAAMYIMLPYFFGAAAEQDPSGRAAATIGGTYLVVGAVSPFVGGILMQTVGLHAMGIIVLVTGTAAWLAFFTAELSLKRQHTRNPSLPPHELPHPRPEGNPRA